MIKISKDTGQRGKNSKLSLGKLNLLIKTAERHGKKIILKLIAEIKNKIPFKIVFKACLKVHMIFIPEMKKSKK